MRIQNNQPAKNGGWLFKIGENVQKIYEPIRKSIEPKKEINCEDILNNWKKETTPKMLIDFADNLGVDAQALWLLGCVYSHSNNAWAFPMSEPYGTPIGIRLRNDKGDKWAVRGSKQGLFIPDYNSKAGAWLKQKTLYIFEGPTDTAAGLCMGLFSIGRPSCLGCEDYIKEFIKISNVSRVVVVSDQDSPGIKGAEKLQGMLNVTNCIWIPPCKDVREFLRLGGSYDIMQSSLKDIVWLKILEKHEQN